MPALGEPAHQARAGGCGRVGMRDPAGVEAEVQRLATDVLFERQKSSSA
jgi:hypothetical protein